MWTWSRSPGVAGAEGVRLVHPHQGRDVVCLLQLVGQHCSLALSPVQYVGVSLPPGYVLDLGDDVLHPPTGGVEAVVEADRVEGVAEVAQAGEEADRAGGAGAPEAASTTSRTHSSSGRAGSPR